MNRFWIFGIGVSMLFSLSFVSHRHNNNETLNGVNPPNDAWGFEANMVLIHGGTFTMGATSEQGGSGNQNERPTHEVTVSDFYISKYEVTQAQWKAIMGNNPSRYLGDDKPVENVNWDDIQRFLKVLHAKTGVRYRLPTEAEWEYAARGGKSEGFKYSGGNKIDSVAWYSQNSQSNSSNNGLHPVGKKKPNEFGLYDMSGNVTEFCADWYEGYSSDSQTDPKGAAPGGVNAYVVSRGGCWRCSADNCRVSCRLAFTPYDRTANHGSFGLRLARSK